MPLVIQKYGGSSLADSRCVLNCARRIVETRRAGHEVVVVVSAMGDATDDLLQLAAQVNPAPDRRGLDLLLASGEQVSTALMGMAINAIGGRFGCAAAALNINELGIHTDGDHCEAQIESIDTRRIEQELEDGRIVIVPGFQGITPMGHVATLGRGGSDITAVALAAALRMRDPRVRCEIYTDVDGVFTADPNLVPGATQLDTLSHDDMIELAAAGASVLHPRSAMLARQAGLDIEVKLSPSRLGDSADAAGIGALKGVGALGRAGTRVTGRELSLETRRVIGCTLQRDLVRLDIEIPAATPTLAWDLAQSVIEHVRPAEMTSPHRAEEGESRTFQLTVPATSTESAERAAARVLHNAAGTRITRHGPLAAVVVVGRCLLGEPQVLAALREAAAAVDPPARPASLTDRRMTLFADHSAGRSLLRAVHNTLQSRGLVGEGTPKGTPDPRPIPAAVARETSPL